MNLGNLSYWFYKESGSFVALVSLIIFILFIALVLPGQSAAADQYSGETGSPDLSFFYSPDDLYRMADAFGPAGRQAYIHARFTFDLAFPLVYGFFLTVCISWLLKHALLPGNSWKLLNLLPATGVIFDLLENISASLVIGRYPAKTPVPATLAPFFTGIKWIFVGGSFTLLLVSIILLVFTKRKN
jgi:hypothetical protein